VGIGMVIGECDGRIITLNNSLFSSFMARGSPK
jgi:hypothetical protein